MNIPNAISRRLSALLFIVSSFAVVSALTQNTTFTIRLSAPTRDFTALRDS